MKAITVRLTDAEDNALQAYAQRCGISKNMAVKRLILGEDFITYILDYFQLDKLEAITQAVRPAIHKEIWKRSHQRPADPGQPEPARTIMD